MHLFLDWKVLLVSLGLSSSVLGQNPKDSTVLQDFRDRWVVYSDVGYTTSPFSISYPFSGELDKIQYRNNFRTILGIGVAYKWFALRLGIPVLNRYRSSEKYSKTDQFNIELDYSFRNFYIETQLNLCRGYAALNAAQWDNEIIAENELFPNLLSYNFSLGTWYFRDKNFKINALLGKRAHYLKEVKTWYLKSTFNIFGLDNLGNPILPLNLTNNSETRTLANRVGSFDVGLIPGYAYVNRLNNWQFSGWAGLGAVVQAKGYSATSGADRVFLGLAPRYDFRLMGGYSVPDWFVFLVTDFDNKSMQFNDLTFRQYFYSIKLVAGKRFG